MDTIRRASWANVTLAEYAALRVLQHLHTIDLLNATWDDIHAHNPFRADEPNRFKPEGEVWLEDLRTRVRDTLDENVLIACAREFVQEMGTLMTMGAKRRI